VELDNVLPQNLDNMINKTLHKGLEAAVLQNLPAVSLVGLIFCFVATLFVRAGETPARARPAVLSLRGFEPVRLISWQ